jgi:hypothetical protein
MDPRQCLDNDSICLRYIVVATRKEALVLIVGITGLVVASDLAVVMLCILPEMVRIDPRVEQKHMLAGQ